ncbi:Type I restriction modification DNA specificity domain [uncultured Clostridium sp.]|uniref:restriction endonuclease subunit S n=1 Tax=uncultured Clostridium sp. TaxID=59620 RepID=UPI000821E198|nr:restriction endonuclease subunit S [uncultured Clostridium sp.]SCK02026.1 Type I restriction modification DNA specificity domain [uncultured Clostridium sp.]
MYEMKMVRFNDMFELQRGKVISKKYINENNGKYPVFSTKVDEAFGYIDTYMLDGKYLLWNTDGIAGYIRIADGRFSYTNIVGIMLFKEEFKSENISLEYIKNYLEPIFRKNVKGRMGENGKNEYTKLNSTMIEELDIMIPIPIKKDGIFDIVAQEEIVKKYEAIKLKKDELLKKKSEIEQINISFTENLNTTNEKIKKICDKCASNKTLTKEKLKDKKDLYPVYAGSVNTPLGYSDSYNNEKDALLVINDGDSGKTYTIKNQKYTIGKHVTGLTIKEEYLNLLDLDYLKIVSEPLFIQKNKSQGRGNLPQRDILDTEVPIPINLDGTYDLKKQKEIANKYKSIENIKKTISKKILELTDIQIIF